MREPSSRGLWSSWQSSLSCWPSPGTADGRLREVRAETKRFRNRKNAPEDRPRRSRVDNRPINLTAYRKESHRAWQIFLENSRGNSARLRRDRHRFRAFETILTVGMTFDDHHGRDRNRQRDASEQDTDEFQRLTVCHDPPLSLRPASSPFPAMAISHDHQVLRP